MDRDVAVTNDGFILHGTLTAPSSQGTSAVVLMLHGSGPLDRNENMKGQALDIFNVLAEKLSDAGYASVRYDKRGCGISEGDYYRTGHTDYLSDALAWTNALAEGRFGGFSKIYLLGHSLGTLIGAQVAKQNASIAGLIQICPFIEKLEQILHQQANTLQAGIEQLRGKQRLFWRILTFLFGKPTQNQEKLIHRLKTRHEDYFRVGFQKIEAKSLRELMAIDPAEEYRGLQIPVFLLGGEKDVQCDPQDCHRIAKLSGTSTTVHIEPDLTHILRKDVRPPSIFTYPDQLKHPPDPVVAERVIDWLDRQT